MSSAVFIARIENSRYFDDDTLGLSVAKLSHPDEALIENQDRDRVLPIAFVEPAGIL